MDLHPPSCGILTLLTDFGRADGYVAAMKGIVLSISPTLNIVDITHDVPRQDIFQAALVLKQVAPNFPAGTVHVVVVDPGVGTERRPIVVEAGDHYFVGPDNGVLSLAAAKPRRAYHITNRDLMLERLSHTFHGRDIFAPTGAHLACSADPEQTGSAIDDMVEIPLPQPTVDEGTITGEVIYADQYGNLLVNITEDYLSKLGPDSMTLTVSGISIEGLKKTYGDVSIGELVFYIGSTGYLEVARREGNARHYLGAPRGAQVVLHHG